MALRTDYKDFILDASMLGKQRFRNTTNPDGSYSIQDVSVYEQDGDVITASMLNGINTVANSLSDAETRAAASATAAANSATSASSSASSASSSASAADTKASEAAQSATNASTSATSAAGSADTALGYANNASSSATAAAGSATAAAGSATSAQGYMNQAKDYRDEAASIVGIGIATVSTAGIVKPDGSSITITNDGTISTQVISASQWAEIETLLGID